MRKLITFILISLLYYSSANAQRYFKMDITYPETGTTGNVSFDFVGVNTPYICETIIKDENGEPIDTVIGTEINNIDSIFKIFLVNAIDTVTNDYIGGGMFYIGTYSSNNPGEQLYLGTEHNITFNSLQNTSTTSVCNGFCYSTLNSHVSTDNDTFTYLLRKDSIETEVSSLNIDNLCEGYYLLTLSYNNNPYYMVTFYIDAGITISPSYSVNALTNSSSTHTSCDGSAKAVINGGTAPYLYAWNNGTYTSSDSISNLCVGLQTLSVIDANSDTVTINFGITDLSSTYNNPNNTGMIPSDTLSFFIENCDIDYNLAIDSAFISNSTIIDTNTFVLECEIWQSGTSYQTFDTLNFNTVGTNYLEIVFYCDANKSTTSLIKITDYVNIENISNVYKIAENNINLFPNPSNGKFTINGKNINNITITDINGRIIKSINASSNNINIDLSGKQKGIYFIKINSKNNNIVKKIILR